MQNTNIVYSTQYISTKKTALVDQNSHLPTLISKFSVSHYNKPIITYLLKEATYWQVGQPYYDGLVAKGCIAKHIWGGAYVLTTV